MGCGGSKAADTSQPAAHGGGSGSKNLVESSSGGSNVARVYEASLFSPQSQYLSNDGSFTKSQIAAPWKLKLLTPDLVSGVKVRLQAADGRYLRSDGKESSDPGWLKDADSSCTWILLFKGAMLSAETPVQLKSPMNYGHEPCMCTDTPTGGWGGTVKGKYSWCPEGRGDAFWRLHGLRETTAEPAARELAQAGGSPPRIEGTYDGPEGLRYELHSQSGSTVQAKIFARGRDTKIRYAMRHAHGHVWQGKLPAAVHGGAAITWTFDADGHAFSSAAHGKPVRRFTKSGRAAAGGGTGGGEWVGEIRTLDMKRAHGRGGFKIHPVLAVTGRTVGGKEELVPGFVDPFNHVNHSLAYHKAMYKAVKGHALPKGETLDDEHAVGWMDASKPVHGHRSVAYTGPVHMGIAQNHDGNGNWIYGDIIDGVMWYEWWGAHKKTRDFQYVRVTEVSRTVNAKGDWPWSKLVEQGQWPGGGVQEALNPKLAGELAQAAWDGDLTRVRSLLDSGAPPNTEAHGGFSNGHHSALNGAARNGHAAIVSLLLEQPTKPDVESRCQSPWEVTPLQQAGFWGRAEVAPVLLQHGASVTSISGPGCGHKTAKQIAQEQRHNQWEEFVQILDTYAEGGSLSGTWFSVEKANGHHNGDRYEFRREGERYYIIRPPGGARNEDDFFTFDGTTTVRHVHGPTSTLLPSGDLHWDLEGGKWLSRREEGGGGGGDAHSDANGAVTLSGFSGYNARLNGEYTADGDSVNGKPVYAHMHHEGVGAGHNWCRMWYAHGAWRIGHVSWVHGDNALAVAFVKSGAALPGQIEPGAQWMEHKGQGGGQDYGKDERQFKSAGEVIASGGATSQQVLPAGAASPPGGGGNFKIENVASGRRLWAREGAFETHGNYEVQAFGACAPEQHVYPDQWWRLEVVSDGVYKIVNAASNRRLWARPDCAAEGVGAHSPVGFGACGHDGVFPDQFWRIERVEGSVYKLVNDQSHRRVFARAGATEEKGFGACPPSAPESAEQHWRLQPDPFPNELGGSGSNGGGLMGQLLGWLSPSGDAHGSANGAVTYYSPVPSCPEKVGSGWMLYMYAGAWEDNIVATRTLSYPHNPNGVGQLHPHPTEGLAKMGHADFDACRFTEVLAVDGIGTWAIVKRLDGGCISAVDAFGAAKAGFHVEFNEGHSFVTAASPLKRRGSDHFIGGPFYDDETNSGHMNNFMFMTIGNPAYPNRGGVTGNMLPVANGRDWQRHRASILPGHGSYQDPQKDHYAYASGNGLSIWAWYGRAGITEGNKNSPGIQGPGAQSSASVVTPAIVMGTPLVGKAVLPTEGVAGGSGEPPPLIEMVERFKAELGLEGNVAQVVTAACKELGVSTDGNSILQQASECYRHLGGMGS